VTVAEAPTRIERTQLTPKQLQIWDIIGEAPPSSITLIGYGGAAGGGKTRALVEAAIDYLQDFPGSKICIARKDLKDLRTTTKEQFDLHCPPGLIWRQNKLENWVDIRMNDWPEGVYSRVEFRELKDYLGMASEEYCAAFFDEAGEIPVKSVLMMLSRLRRPLQPAAMQMRKSEEYPDGKPPKYLLVCASNPWPGWFEQWFLRGEFDAEVLEATGGSVHFIPAKSEDNPYLPDNYREQLLAFYPQDWVNRMLDGRWDAFEGQVYPQFNPLIHKWLGDLPERAAVAKIVGGLDFGGNDPRAHWSAGIVGLLTRSNRLIRVAEFEQRGSSIAETQMQWMLAQQLKWREKYGIRIQWVADKSQMVAIQLWQRQGFRIKPSKGGKGSVEAGIQLVSRRLDPDPNGIPGSFYLPELKKFEHRIRMYRYDEPRDDGREQLKVEPLKIDDDLPDADRYMHEFIDFGAYGTPDSGQLDAILSAKAKPTWL
jgi:phage terminase large subunit